MSNAASRGAQSKLKTPSRETGARAKAARATEAKKIARLRGLRLAKETTDREAAQQAAPVAIDFSVPPGRQALEIRRPPFRGMP